MILLEDEAGFHRQPTMANVWAPAGQAQPRAAYSQTNNPCVRVGATFDPICGTFVHRESPSFTADEMGLFYNCISQAYRQAKRIFLVMDNWPVHSHPKAWSAIEADPRIQVLWLPTYAPWLNPIEKVWKWVRQRLSHMHPYSGAWTTFRELLGATLDSINDIPEEILRYAGTSGSKLYSS